MGSTRVGRCGASGVVSSFWDGIVWRETAPAGDADQSVAGGEKKENAGKWGGGGEWAGLRNEKVV